MTKPMSAEQLADIAWKGETPWLELKAMIEQRDAAIRAEAVAGERERCARVAETSQPELHGKYRGLGSATHAREGTMQAAATKVERIRCSTAIAAAIRGTP